MLAEDNRIINYDGVETFGWNAEKRSEVERQALDIKSCLQRNTLEMLEIGNKLLAFKDLIGHGQFERFREDNFPVTPRTAQRYQLTAHHFYEFRDLVKFLFKGDVQQLAENKALQSVRDELLTQLQKGETPDAKYYHDAIEAIETGCSTVGDEPVKLRKKRVKANDRKIKDQSQRGEKVEANENEPDHVRKIVDLITPKELSAQKVLFDLIQTEEGWRSLRQSMAARLKDLIDRSQTGQND